MCILDFGGGGGMEAELSRPTVPVRPYVFPVGEGQDPNALADALNKANPDCICSVIGPTALSVILPPSIKIGDDPIDLRKLAFVLTAHKAVGDLGLGGEMEICCGDHGGCCAN